MPDSHGQFLQWVNSTRSGDRRHCNLALRRAQLPQRRCRFRESRAVPPAKHLSQPTEPSSHAMSDAWKMPGAFVRRRPPTSRPGTKARIFGSPALPATDRTVAVGRVRSVHGSSVARNGTVRTHALSPATGDGTCDRPPRAQRSRPCPDTGARAKSGVGNRQASAVSRKQRRPCDGQAHQARRRPAETGRRAFARAQVSPTPGHEGTGPMPSDRFLANGGTCHRA